MFVVIYDLVCERLRVGCAGAGCLDGVVCVWVCGCVCGFGDLWVRGLVEVRGLSWELHGFGWRQDRREWATKLVRRAPRLGSNG